MVLAALNFAGVRAELMVPEAHIADQLAGSGGAGGPQRWGTVVIAGSCRGLPKIASAESTVIPAPVPAGVESAAIARTIGRTAVARNINLLMRTPGLEVRLVNLPGYSPDFNADEAVWGWAREEATGGLCLGTKALVQERVGNFLPWLFSRERGGQVPLSHRPAIKGRRVPAGIPATFPTHGKCTSHLGLSLVSTNRDPPPFSSHVNWCLFCQWTVVHSTTH